jgi:hypothetical protein
MEREDWTSFRTVEGLQQKAGVPKDLLRRLVLKELTDNALDSGADEVEVEALADGSYVIADNGPGIDGGAEAIARLYSINRRAISSKWWRMPNRGALGNGLRVVAGAVLASEGKGCLTVTTHDRRIVLRPERDGSTTVVSVETVEFPRGTKVEIMFGPALPDDPDPLHWARIAKRFAQYGTSYGGKPSPYWYDVAYFRELLDASGQRPVRDLIANLDGCTGGRAGEIVATAGLSRAICADVTSAQAKELLAVAQQYAKPVRPQRLGALGPELYSGTAYACARGVLDEPEIPFVVEAWAKPADEETSLGVSVNRTPVTGAIEAAREQRDINAFGCGLAHTIAQAPKDKHFSIWLNITTPYMPITSDGKEPDLVPFLEQIQAAVGKAVRKARRPKARGEGGSQKDVVLDHLDEVIAEVSGDGEFRFNPRQLFYGLRPIVMNELHEDLKEGNFNKIITDYENENGEIPGMYHEPRGSITHPHRAETITLGTLMVEEYERPAWTFNKLVYIEKEGANEALKAAGWPERHDCAVMSSKGFSTRAARDLIDKLAEHDEPVTVFCAHDADGYGTIIYQTLQAATKAREARKIEIINIGLEPWEAVAMGLEVENVEVTKSKRTNEPIYKPVADYVKLADTFGEHGTAPDGETWEEWLQTHRVELNAMTTPDFIAWLDRKMAEHAKETRLPDKLIPPADVLTAEFDQRIEEKVRTTLTERILREAGLDQQVKDAIAKVKKPSGQVLAKGIRQSFKEQAEREWRAHIEAEAKARTLKI